jgi:hypothetical protein
MQQLDEDLWIADSPLGFFGLEVGARMTVVRLPDSKLLLHSPIALTAELVREVEALGSVEFLVAPNRFHHLFVAAWQGAFPKALLYAAPGLETKRSDLNIAGVLGDAPDSGWAPVLDQVLLAGCPLVNEIAFFHRPSATLIATDLAFNVGTTSPPLTRLAFRMVGGYGEPSPTLLERFLVRDRAAFRESLERVLEWPFERVVVAHGEVCEQGGRAALVRGYQWVLGGERRS